jgi:hypothetical protein
MAKIPTCILQIEAYGRNRYRKDPIEVEDKFEKLLVQLTL